MTKVDSFMEGNQLIYRMEIVSESVDQFDWTTYEGVGTLNVYEDDNRIYVQNRNNNEYSLQYDFNLEVGDSIVYNIDFSDLFPCENKVVYYLDSLSTFEMGGQSLIQQHFNVVDSIFEFSGERIVVETIGSISNGLFRLTDSHPCFFDGPGGFLCSFENKDSEFSFSNWQLDCFELPTSIKDESRDQIQIYPNPTTDKLYIDNIQGIDQINIYNVSGRLLFSEFACSELNVSSLRSGIYMIELKTKSKNSAWKKFVKH